MNSGVPAHFEIDLPAKQDVTLVTGVYDWGTGEIGTLQILLDTGYEEKMMALQALAHK